MTNNINGIDVSECEFYFEDNGVIAPDGTPERANICTSPEKSCENNDSCYCNKDCYFKQLKRLQEENEKLKENQCCPETCEHIATEIIRYSNVCEVNSKYKQALEEIRVFSKNFCGDKCPFYENEYSEVCNEACLLDNIVNPILKKINEVLNDRD